MSIGEKYTQMKEMEGRMDEMITKLSHEHSFHIGDSMVGRDGFPRNDIDVYLVSKILGDYYKTKGEWMLLRKEVEDTLSQKLGKSSPE